MQLLTSSHVRDRDKALLRGILSCGVWNGFLLGKVRGENVPCRFCGEGDGHFFGIERTHLLSTSGRAVNLQTLLVVMRGLGLGVFSGTGWLQARIAGQGHSPRALEAAEYRLEYAHGIFLLELTGSHQFQH